MSDPFQPLLRLVTLAISPQGRFFATSSSPGGGVSAPPSNSETRPDRHSLAPEVVVWEYAPDVDCAPYDPITRYQVAAKDKKGDMWVTLNSASQTLPPPPDRSLGPVGCYCRDIDGKHGTRYGSAQQKLALWCPTFFDTRHVSAPFTPDLFLGEGPCFAISQQGDLAQWDPDWTEPYEGRTRVREQKWQDFCYHDMVDECARRALRLRVLPSFFPPPRYADDGAALLRDYGTWVAYKQELRGQILERLVRDGYWKRFKDDYPDLWQDLHLVGYFVYPPVGVWVRDTLVRAREIGELQGYGVPVYYRWNEEFDDEARFPRLAAIRPRFLYKRSSAPPVRVVPKTPPGSPPTRARDGSVLAEPAERGHASLPPPNVAPPESGERAPTSPTAMPDSQDEQYWRNASELVQELGVENRAKYRRARSQQQAARWAESNTPVDEEANWTVTPPPISVRVDSGRADRERVRNKVATVVADRTQSPERASFSQIGILSNPPESVPVPALLKRMREDPTSRDPPQLRLFVTDTESAEELLRGYLKVKGKEADNDGVIQFLIARRMPFKLMVPAPPIEVRASAFEIPVGSHLYVTKGGALVDCFSQWVESVRTILHGVRAARAAFLYGGLVSRIAEYTGLEPMFRKYPSPFVCSSGSPNVLENDGNKFCDDWLSANELRVFVGATGPGKDAPSLLPPVDLFDTFYAGSWANTYEEWFCERINELRTGSRKGKAARALCSRREWKLMLKGYPFGKE
ncbi:hypothetical protein AURDEDRAFT_166434 [Auricularia subglabra TFB-10046 SS5]|uniref:Uncharacterized protein n=1 Tax=Auricularia subglabra (strain TFB-10046 / SS5) TaxID=717982 RepID=J0D3G8_AURST|nr:hypothetical protein AURDEDRAFT_166434 [Auricularia subglabra TFB-10046 SS5]